MALIQVPTVPIRLNQFTTVFLTNTFRGVTLDGGHMCWTTGNNAIVIQRLAYRPTDTPITLQGSATDYIGVSITGFQGRVSKAPIYVDSDRILVMRRGDGAVSWWNKDGTLRGVIPGPDTNVVYEGQTFFANYATIRKNPRRKGGDIVKTYVYDNCSYNASVIIDRRTNATKVLTRDYPITNVNVFAWRAPLMGSNFSYGLTFPSANSLDVDVVGEGDLFAILNNDVSPGTLQIRNEDKSMNMMYGDDRDSGYISCAPYALRQSIATITPMVQCNSSSSSRTFSLIDFNLKYWKLVGDNAEEYCMTRCIPVELLIPKTFIEPFSNTIFNVGGGTFTMRMYTNGDSFGAMSIVGGTPFMFLAAFPAERTIPINNYSFGIGAMKNG